MKPFSFDSNHCLCCEEELPEKCVSLFCSACDPKREDEKEKILYLTRDSRVEVKKPIEAWLKRDVSDMEDGEEGYVKPSSIYRDAYSYRIHSEAEVRSQAENGFTLKILRFKELVLVDLNSIGNRWFANLDAPAGEIISFEVRIVRFDP